MGEWLLPSGSFVPRTVSQDFFRTGYIQQVRLNRQNRAKLPTGVYVCVVPDGRDSALIHSAIITLGMAPQHIFI